MKVKLLAILLLAVIISGTIGIVTGSSKDSGVSDAPRASANAAPQEPRGTIDGARNPELIPDHVAYLLMFRFIAGGQTAGTRERIEPYIRQIGLGDQECSSCPRRRNFEDRDADINALLAAADEFQQRVGALDNQVIEIKRRNWPNPSPEVMAQLTRLQRQKEAIVMEIMASLPGRLSAEGMDRLRVHINERVKRRIKMNARQGQDRGSLLSGVGE